MKLAPLFVCLFCVLCAYKSVAQAPLSSGYYVIVSAYKNTREAYAKKYTDALKLKGHDAHYGLSKSGKLYLVYVHYDTDRSESLSEMKGVRQKGEFTDAWVRVVKGVQPSIATTETPDKTSNPAVAVTVHKEEVKPNKEVPKENNIVTAPPASQPESVKPAQHEVKETVSTTPEPAQPTTAQNSASVPAAEIPKVGIQGTLAYLNLNYTTKNEPVDGEIQLIDTERSRLIEKVNGNRVIVLPDPKSKSDQLTLIADVFGYRKVQHEIKYPLSLADTTQDFVTIGDSALVITFDLIRYHRGDIQTLYHVYFYNDAVIMLPESKYELNSLVQMMQENNQLRIKLHGHSNGNHHGKILSLGPNKNFFDMEGTVQGMGSAKDLSGQRAGVIKEYLIVNGIAADRVETKAWAGRKPIYDKHSVNAKKNVRVEVEILSD